MSTLPVLIHIGFPKTASTMFQTKIFNDGNLGFGTLGQFGYDQILLRNMIFYNDDFSFDGEQIREGLDSTINKIYSLDLVPVLSDERLCGWDRWGYPYHQKTVSDRIQEVFPSGKVLFFIREQVTEILSIYNQMVKHSFYGSSLDVFLKKFNTYSNQPYLVWHPVEGSPDFSLYPSNLFYDKLLKYYQDKFGLDNVLVLPFELFQKEQTKIIKQVMDFAEVKIKIQDVTQYLDDQIAKEYVNVGLKAGVLDFKSKLNGILQHPILGKSKGRKVKIRISDQISRSLQKMISPEKHKEKEKEIKQLISDRLGDIYKQSNQKTSELIGIDLSELGYLT